MKVTLISALLVSLGSQQPPAGQPANAQAIATQAIAEAADPADCLKALRTFVSKRQQEVRPPTGFTAELLKQVDGEKLVLAGTCVARFDATKIKDSQLSGLAELYAEARLPAEAQATLERALAATLPPADRANTLISAMNALFSQPKSDARNARLEAIVDELDANAGATLDQKWAAHGRLASYYRGDDIDAGIIKHGAWMAVVAKSFTPDQRTKYGSRLVSSQVSVAEALAGQGMNDEALALLRRIAAEWKDIPRANEQITPVLERYLLVGTPAAAIKAPRWLNAPAGVTEMPMTGAVTLLEFTAHWCGPCRESYPGVNRLRQQFGAQGFRVVMATRYYGYFSSEGNLAAEDELKRDAEYFKSYQLDVPVAVGDQVSVKVMDGKVTYVPGPDPNDTSYKVGGIPQIHLIDKQGRIRLIMVGYDDANEPKLADRIRKLLAEK
jgi:thiol-disulfide isomerase/thioredoxin